MLEKAIEWQGSGEAVQSQGGMAHIPVGMPCSLSGTPATESSASDIRHAGAANAAVEALAPAVFPASSPYAQDVQFTLAPSPPAPIQGRPVQMVNRGTSARLGAARSLQHVRRVLVVEDNVTIRRALVRTLMNLGVAQVDGVSDGLQAVNSVATVGVAAYDGTTMD